MADAERTTRICFCPQRLNAMGSNTFRFSHQWGGWYLTDAPTRSMSSRTRYMVYAERNDGAHEDHTGEPTVFQECPWCQHTLPGCLDDTSQADGEGD